MQTSGNIYNCEKIEKIHAIEDITFLGMPPNESSARDAAQTKKKIRKNLNIKQIEGSKK